MREEGYSISQAALATNSVKLNPVPRMTLSNRLQYKSPQKDPKVGRPAELPLAVEQEIVKCLKFCAEYQYPMRKADLQQLVQSYCTKKCIKTRWTYNLPAKDWIQGFKQRWSHEVGIIYSFMVLVPVCY